MSDLQCRVQTGADPPAITPWATFTLFPKLAPELRLKIWKQALPGPRLVEIRLDKHACTSSHCSTPSVLHVCSESRTEALKLYTVLPLELAFDVNDLDNCFSSSADSDPFRAVYVNFQIDTIYFNPARDEDGLELPWLWPGYGVEGWVFNPGRDISELPKPGYGVEGWVAQLLNNVRFMAMSYKAWKYVIWEGESIHFMTRFANLEDWGDRGPISFIQRFGNLEELTVVVFDVGTGKIDDEHKLEVWDEWRIGDEVGVSIRTGEVQACNSDRELVKLVEMAVMTRECGGLNNMKVRIGTFDRGGLEEV